MSRKSVPRRRAWGGIAVLTLTGMVVGAWAVAASPIFHIREVRVNGNRHLSASEVVRLAGIADDANLLALPAEGVERALARNPWIGSAQVHRSLPSTLVVTIEERSPVAWVGQPKGVAVVAADGTVLSRRTNPPEGIVAIGRSGRALGPGARIRGFDDQLAVVASLGPSLRRQVERARLERGEMVLRLEDGTLVRYGEARYLNEKNEALAKVLRWAGKQGAELTYVDLRVTGNPAVKVRGA
ncbi:MAG TPA: FtsQ-type POTRA domain-containing protein [Actinomycetota bacterium]|jgi:cell division protein FtsQ|nr:FtsQ-type POTRA domain-containing protein [Actinomycetota bacterium]